VNDQQRFISRRGLLGAGAVLGSLALGGGLTACGSGTGAAPQTSGAGALKGALIARSAPAVQDVEAVAQKYMKQQVESYGARWVASQAAGDAGKQRSQAEQFISQGAKALIMTCVSMEGWEPTYAKATEKGIAVVNHSGGPITGATVNQIQDQAKGGEEIGKVVGQWIRDKHNGEGVVGFMATLSIPAFLPRTERARDIIKEMNPNVRFLEPVEAYTPEMGAKAGANLIQANRDMTVLVSVNDDAALGAMQALKEAGKTNPDEFLLTGFDATERAQQLIREKSVLQYSWSYVIPYSFVQAVRYAADKIDGKDVKPTARVVGFMVTGENLEEYVKWANDPLADENQARYAELIETSDRPIKTGDAVGSAFA
jgi:ribose transport system substrate-binding protein